MKRVIGTAPREFLDHILFFNERNLKKPDSLQKYYNEIRAHLSLEHQTPQATANGMQKVNFRAARTLDSQFNTTPNTSSVFMLLFA